MGKKAAERRLGDTEAMAVLRNVRVSPRKLNLVAEMIRGMPADQAITALGFSRRRIAGTVLKAVHSAVSNAENNHQLDVDRLYVKEATVGKGLVMRRIRPQARGRAGRIRKPFSHLTIVVCEREETA